MKKNTKKMNIKTKISLNNNIFFISNDDKKLNLEDDTNKLLEKDNDTLLKFIDQDSNKSILLRKNTLLSFYENKYTINKPNILNDKLIEYYCPNKVNSNAYIQVIHNLEDIKKILILYINDVICH